MRLDALEQTTIDALFADMRAEAEAVVRLGVPQGALVETRTGFMRYRGQGHEVAVPLPDGPLDPAALRAAFDATYARVYGRVIPRLEVEAVTWTLSLAEPHELPARLPLPPDAGAAMPSGQCRIVETATGEAVDASVFVRSALPKGARLAGPAVIVEDGTSTIVPSGYQRAHQRRRRHRDRGDRGVTRRNISEIELQIMWNRLLSVVEEQAQTLVRTAFSTSAREAGDISAGVFDLAGRMLAQAVTGTPGHINTMARSVGHFLEVFPVAQMKEGDVYVTNDPWKGTGHLYDLVVVSPTFMDGRIVALFACTTHLVDMGGVGQTPEGRQIYHEGLFIPLLRLARAGEMNEDLLAMIRANVREPVQVIGDVYALIACNEIGSRRLVAMMREFALRDLDMLGEAIISRSRQGMAEAIGKLPQGTWTASMRIDGYEAPIDLVGTLTIGRDTIHVDYTGTSGMSSYAINCPLCYTEAYTTFGVNCVVAPHIPNNTGTLDAVRVTAPEGTILSATHPAAVYARSVMGHMLPDVVYGCLDQALPGRVPAEGTSNLWTLNLIAGHGLTGIGRAAGTPFMVNSFHSGGAGARPKQDGLSATPFPSGVRNVPVEATEAITPLVIWRKELRQDSGGAGRQRGGLGQVMEIGSREDAAFGIFARFERVKYPARGRHGGGEGQAGRLSLKSGAELKPKGLAVVPPGDRLVVEMPGGGGMGPARSATPRRCGATCGWDMCRAKQHWRTIDRKNRSTAKTRRHQALTRHFVPSCPCGALLSIIHTSFRQFRFVHPQPQSRPFRQMEQPVHRLRRVLEHRVRARRRIVPLDRLARLQLRRHDMHVGQVADHRLRLVRHQLDAVRLRQRRAAHQAGDAAHLDDVRLHHAHAGIDQIGERRQRIGLFAGRHGDVERARDLAHRLDVVVLHRLLEPPVAKFLQRAADADRAADREAVVGIEGERERIADQLAHRACLGDVAGNVAVQHACGRIVEADLDRGRLVLQPRLDDAQHLVQAAFAVAADRGVERQRGAPGAAEQLVDRQAESACP